MRNTVKTILIIKLVTLSGYAMASESTILTLEKAVTIAAQRDPWLLGSKYREDAIVANSIASGSLPDPVVSIGFANLPTDGFAFDQEPMTQLKVGVSQMFPRGDSLDIRKKQLTELAQQQPLLRQDRSAKSLVSVSSLWLEVYRAQQSIALLEQDRALFEQLGDIAQASYSSAYGKVRQQDVVRAQLELSRLDDRLTMLLSMQDMAKAQLWEWLTGGEGFGSGNFAEVMLFSVPDSLPDIPSLPDYAMQLIMNRNQQSLAETFMSHPVIKAIEQKITASETGVELANQKYKPQWGVNAGYSYRADDQANRSRADFVSIGVSFDVPLFTENRQDKEVKAAISQSEAIKTDKLLALRSMFSGVQNVFAKYQRLVERQMLYKNDILRQMREQAEASLTSYTNDDGDFAEVVRARIADLNARIDALNIDVELAKSKVQLGYFFTGTAVNAPMQFGDTQ